jgi:hypothetical protein
MNLFGRRVVRHVAAIGAGTALLLLGLEVPAYAAVPTITAILPTSPSPGCQATLTGTNFQLAANGGPITSVTFQQPPAAAVAGTLVNVDADTQAEVGLPGGLTVSTATTVLVHNTSGDSATFSFTTGPAGTCPDVPTFTPTSGAVGTSVTITPTGGGSPSFGTAPTAVRFNTTLATPTSSTATSVTVLVPCGATTGPVHVYTTAGQRTSTSNFTVTGGGAGAPTITSFTPTSGPTGTSVTITGTNFSGTGFTTTSVTFNSVTATFTVPSATQIKATVPSTATTGPIKVTTGCGSATSTTNFTVTVITKHGRSVTLRLSDTLHVAGHVSVGDGFAACRSAVPVRIQRRVNGVWKTIRKATTTSTGKYAGHVKNKHGKYRTLAPKITLNSGADICKKAVSPVRKH